MTQIGTVYGEALYSLAKEETLSPEILEELKTLRTAFDQEPDFLRLLAAPNLPKEQRCRILDDSFGGKIQQYLLNFLKLLTEKGYIRHFSDCVDAYRDHYNEDNGILPVKAITAAPLSAQQAEKLTGKLVSITGKTIELTNQVDPACLGGIRLDYDGKRVEDTVASRLDAIRNLLKTTVI